MKLQDKFTANYPEDPDFLTFEIGDYTLNVFESKLQHDLGNGQWVADSESEWFAEIYTDLSIPPTYMSDGFATKEEAFTWVENTFFPIVRKYVEFFLEIATQKELRNIEKHASLHSVLGC